MTHNFALCIIYYNNIDFFDVYIIDNIKRNSFFTNSFNNIYRGKTISGLYKIFSTNCQIKLVYYNILESGLVKRISG